MPALEECGHCVPTFTLTDLELVSINPEYPSSWAGLVSITPASQGLIPYTLGFSFTACIKDIKCVSNSAPPIPRPDKGRGLPRLPDFNNGMMLNINNGLGIDITIPPVTVPLNNWGIATGVPYGTDYTWDVCCKTGHVDCCKVMKDVLCDTLKRQYEQLLTPAHSTCCWTGSFEYLLVGIPTGFDGTFGTIDVLDSWLNLIKRTITNKFIKNLTGSLFDIMALGGYAKPIYDNRINSKAGIRFDPLPEDPIVGSWNHDCLCLRGPDADLDRAAAGLPPRFDQCP